MKPKPDHRPLLAALLVATVALVLVLGWIAFGPGSRPLPASHGQATPVVAGSVAVAAFGNPMTFNASAGNTIVLTLQDNVTASSIANPERGQVVTFIICQDAAGGHTMTWPENLKLSGGVFTLTPDAEKCDSLTAVFDGNNWYETARSLDQ